MARRTHARSPWALREHNLDRTRGRALVWIAATLLLVAATAAMDGSRQRGADGEADVARDSGLDHAIAVGNLNDQGHHEAERMKMTGAMDGAEARAPAAPKDTKVITVAPPADDGRVKIGKEWYRPARVIRMRVTAYSPDERSCGKFADGITASGRPVTANGGRLVAADTRLLPFGTMVSVPGYGGGRPVPVLDRGGAIKGRRLDVLYATHERAMQWGVRWLDVTVWESVGKTGEPVRLSAR